MNILCEKLILYYRTNTTLEYTVPGVADGTTLKLSVRLTPDWNTPSMCDAEGVVTAGKVVFDCDTYTAEFCSVCKSNDMAWLEVYDDTAAERMVYLQRRVVIKSRVGTLDGQPPAPPEEYYTISQVDAILENYVTSANLDELIAHYVTTDELTTTLANYMLSSDLATTLTQYVTNSALVTTLTSYITSDGLVTTLSNYVTNGELGTTLAGYVTSSNFETTISGINTALNGKASTSSVTDVSNALTTHTTATNAHSNLVPSVNASANKYKTFRYDVTGSPIASVQELSGGTVNSVGGSYEVVATDGIRYVVDNSESGSWTLRINKGTATSLCYFGILLRFTNAGASFTIASDDVDILYSDGDVPAQFSNDNPPPDMSQANKWYMLRCMYDPDINKLLIAMPYKV